MPIRAVTRAPGLRTIAAPLGWLERARGWRRLALVSLYILVGMLAALVACRYAGLRGLPDVGDPFDVAAYRPGPVLADGEDAAPLFERAADGLKPFRSPPGPGTILLPRGGVIFQLTPVSLQRFSAGWSAAEPALREWVEANRPALEVWRRAVERPATGGGRDRWPFSNATDNFFLMSLLGGSRLEETGDLAGAWAWHRAALRTIRHVGNRDPFSREGAERFYQPIVGRRVERWAADPRVDAGLLRRALADVVALAEMPESDAEALRSAYVALLKRFDEPPPWIDRSAGHDIARTLFRGSRVDGVIPVRVLESIGEGLTPIALFVRHEPERSRRVARLVFANWLGRIDAFSVGDAVLSTASEASFPPLMLLTDADGIPPVPGGLSSADLAAWHESTLLWKHLLPDLRSLQRGRLRRSIGRATLIVRLAEQLYAREHDGVPPAHPGDLVGPYLEALPDGFIEATPDDPGHAEGRGSPGGSSTGGRG